MIVVPRQTKQRPAREARRIVRCWAGRGVDASSLQWVRCFLTPPARALTGQGNGPGIQSTSLLWYDHRRLLAGRCADVGFGRQGAKR
jgi:hypothetical protein